MHTRAVTLRRPPERPARGPRGSGALAGRAAGAVLGLLAGTTAAAAAATSPIAAGIVAAAAAAAVTMAFAVRRPDLVLFAAIVAVALPASVIVSDGTVAIDLWGRSELAKSGLTTTLSEALFLAAGYGWAIGRLLKGRLPFSPHPLTTPLLFLILAFVPGFFVAEDPSAVFKVLVNWVAFLMIFQMLVADADHRMLLRLLACMALTGAVVGVIAIAGTDAGAQSYDPTTHVATQRATGPFPQPGILAPFLLLVVPATAVLAVRGTPRSRCVAAVAGLIACIAIALTLSRGALLALGGVTAVLLVWAPFRYLLALGIVASFALSLVGANPLGKLVNVEVLTQRITSSGAAVRSDDPRLNIFENAPRMIADHPFFGVGADNFVNVAGDYDIFDPLSQIVPHHAHNIALNVAVENGLVGLAALAWFAVVLALLLSSLIRGSRGWYALYAVAATGALLGLTLYGMTDSPLTSNVITSLTVVWLGLVPAIERMSGAGRPATTGAAARSRRGAVAPMPAG